MSLQKSDRQLLAQIVELAEKTVSESRNSLIGLEQTVEDILCVLLTGGHLLLIGLPGVGKTVIVKTLSSLWGMSFNRVQFTPDLMPGDITGTEIIEAGTATSKNLKFRPGPIFANLVLADEINRAPPKTQSSLLEAMEEHQVTYAGVSHKLPDPFLVMATQNPLELEGTYPLPEAQLDRFSISLQLAYPNREDELKIARLETSNSLKKIKFNRLEKAIPEFRSLVEKIPFPESLLQDLVDSVRSTRPGGTKNGVAEKYAVYGAGPRALRHIVALSKARAAIDGDINVNSEHVLKVYTKALQHRIQLNYAARSEGLSVSDFLKETLQLS